MKKGLKILLKGCLGIFILIIILFCIVVYPILFPKKVALSDYTDDYTITAKTRHPKFKPLVNQFKQQQHRFEFDTCEYKYNDQSFFFGDTPEKILSIFGEPDEKDERTHYQFGNSDRYLSKDDAEEIEQLKKDYGDSLHILESTLYYYYNSLKIGISFEEIHNNGYEFKSFRISMSGDSYRYEYKYGKTETLYDVILFRKVPYQLDMTLNEFMELSNLSHKKLRKTGGFHRSFFMFQEECPPTEETRIYTAIDSYASYETEGGGHMTWTGDFDPNESSTIESLSFYLETLESF